MKKVLLILAIAASTALLANDVHHQTKAPTHYANSHSVLHSPKVVHIASHVVKSHPRVVYAHTPHKYYGFNDRAHEYNHWRHDDQREYRR